MSDASLIWIFYRGRLENLLAHLKNYFKFQFDNLFKTHRWNWKNKMQTSKKSMKIYQILKNVYCNTKDIQYGVTAFSMPNV